MTNIIDITSFSISQYEHIETAERSFCLVLDMFSILEVCPLLSSKVSIEAAKRGMAPVSVVVSLTPSGDKRNVPLREIHFTSVGGFGCCYENVFGIVASVEDTLNGVQLAFLLAHEVSEGISSMLRC